MDYTKHYDRLIARAKSRALTLYREEHHAIPRCIGGTNARANLVYLTAEEHFIAHQLLVKMYPDEPKLLFAAQQMTRDPHGQRVNNKLYGWIRRRLANEWKRRKTGVRLKPEHIAKKMAAQRASSKFKEAMADPVANASRSEGMKEVWAARKAAGIKIDNSREYAPLSDEHKARVAAGLKAAWDSGKRSRVVSEEAKRKMRAAKLGRKLTDEHKRKIGEASKRQKGKTLNPEHLANLREAHAETARIRLIHKALHNGMV